MSRLLASLTAPFTTVASAVLRVARRGAAQRKTTRYSAVLVGVMTVGIVQLATLSQAQLPVGQLEYVQGDVNAFKISDTSPYSLGSLKFTMGSTFYDLNQLSGKQIVVGPGEILNLSDAAVLNQLNLSETNWVLFRFATFSSVVLEDKGGQLLEIATADAFLEGPDKGPLQAGQSAPIIAGLPAPEPGALALLVLGGAGAIGAARRMRSRRG